MAGTSAAACARWPTIGRWGVEDLEVIVLNPDERHGAASYSFPHRYLDAHLADVGKVKLKSLKLSNCAPHAFGLDANLPPSRAFSALAMLVLQDMPMSTGRRVYEGVISACPALEVLHLRSCGCHRRCLVVDAPGSRITELLVELTGDTLGMIDLQAAATSLQGRERCISAPTAPTAAVQSFSSALHLRRCRDCCNAASASS